MNELGNYDLVVVGGGLAGLTAGLFAARHGLSTLVFEPAAPGGHLLNCEKIEDFPGFAEGIAGYDLCPTVQEQAANQGAAFEMAAVTGLAPQGDYWLVDTSAGQYRARAVIVASGCHPKELNVPGESRLQGRGISHCASCDGPLFRGQVVGVVGGGDSALQEALTLAGYAARVVVFEREAAFAAQHVYEQRVLGNPSIEVHYNTVVEEVLGDKTVTGVRIRDTITGQEAQVDLAGLWVYVGTEPNTAFLCSLLQLDDSGHIVTDTWLRTKRVGLFAAGEVRRDSAGQAITAAGEGAVAAIAAHRYIRDGRW